MITVAIFDLSCVNEACLPVGVSSKLKSDAFVPKGSMVEGVSAILISLM
jgi:hypothetical protein